MKFPVYSQLAGNLAFSGDEFAEILWRYRPAAGLPPHPHGFSAANLVSGLICSEAMPRRDLLPGRRKKPQSASSLQVRPSRSISAIAEDGPQLPAG
jgi:hypothetical protein